MEDTQLVRYWEGRAAALYEETIRLENERIMEGMKQLHDPAPNIYILIGAVIGAFIMYIILKWVM